MLTQVFPYCRSVRFEQVHLTTDSVEITCVTKRATARCPLCGRRSRRVHSRYWRTVADLPLAGRPVVLRIHVRKFFCSRSFCPRRIFTERLPEVASPYAHRSQGLRSALRHITLAAGGEAGARLATVLGMPASPDTLLREVRSLALPTPGLLQAIGIDEWAWRKGVRYGTVIVDLERHQVAALLPERNADQVAAWLARYPSLQVVSRDRAGLYSDAASRGAPQAMQVADRFHLVRNLGEALETFLLHKRGVLKEAAARVTEVLVPAAPPLPESAAMYTGKRKTPRPRLWQQRVEEASLQRHARVVAAYERVHALRAKGMDIANIARTVGVGRRTVYRYLHLAGPPERKRLGQRPRPQRAAWEAFISHRWEEGCHNGRQLWREARAAGHRCSDSSVARFVADLRRLGPQRVSARRTGGVLTSVQGPTARRVALFLLRPPEKRTPEQALYVEHLCQYEATIAIAHALVQAFMRMLHERQGAHLDAWVEAVAQSGITELHRFAQGLAKDHAAVQAGLSIDYSNGQTEGQIHRLKCIRRSMYGRGKFDLLERRVLLDPRPLRGPVGERSAA